MIKTTIFSPSRSTRNPLGNNKVISQSHHPTHEARPANHESTMPSRILLDAMARPVHEPRDLAPDEPARRQADVGPQRPTLQAHQTTNRLLQVRQLLREVRSGSPGTGGSHPSCHCSEAVFLFEMSCGYSDRRSSSSSPLSGPIDDPQIHNVPSSHLGLSADGSEAHGTAAVRTSG